MRWDTVRRGLRHAGVGGVVHVGRLCGQLTEIGHAIASDHHAADHEDCGLADVADRVRRLAPDGLEAWKQVIERGYEGGVAKDEAGVDDGGAWRWGADKKSWMARGRTDGRGGFSGGTLLTDNQKFVGSMCLR